AGGAFVEAVRARIGIALRHAVDLLGARERPREGRDQVGGDGRVRRVDDDPAVPRPTRDDGPAALIEAHLAELLRTQREKALPGGDTMWRGWPTALDQEIVGCQTGEDDVEHDHLPPAHAYLQRRRTLSASPMTAKIAGSMTAAAQKTASPSSADT